MQLASPSIKVLNPLTNRYHAGILRSQTNASLYLDLPTTAALQPGQQVRFALDGPALVARQTMRRASIAQVSPSANRLSVELIPELAVI